MTLPVLPPSQDVAPASTSRPGADPIAGEPADGLVIAWEGDLDVASAPVLAAAVRVLVDTGSRRVTLDLAAVRFMDCAGLGALVEADSHLADRLWLARPSPAVLRLLGLLGLEDRFGASVLSTPDTDVRGPGATIERSTGLIMATYGCTADQAPKILLSAGLQHNVPVQLLAALLVTVTSTGRVDLAGGPAAAVQRVLGAATVTTTA